jgi:hypothetical protein
VFSAKKRKPAMEHKSFIPIPLCLIGPPASWQ